MTGWDSLCEQQHNSGYSVNGSFAEYDRSGGVSRAAANES
jgi:D-arabinose 1-dehydrogenase-like Zn-dependent alcohol dehydrogenase